MQGSKNLGSLVSSKDELASFIEGLREDFINNPGEWENPTIESFLDAMAAWVRSMDNVYKNAGMPPVASPTWSVFADILQAAKIYE